MGTRSSGRWIVLVYLDWVELVRMLDVEEILFSVSITFKAVQNHMPLGKGLRF